MDRKLRSLGGPSEVETVSVLGLDQWEETDAEPEEQEVVR